MRRCVRDIGNAKSRRNGLYAIEQYEGKDQENQLLVLSFLYLRSEDPDQKRMLFFLMCDLNERIEGLRRDNHVISEPVERLSPLQLTLRSRQFHPSLSI